MNEPHRHLHPACAVCGRHHGSGISCATYAVWSEALQDYERLVAGCRRAGAPEAGSETGVALTEARGDDDGR